MNSGRRALAVGSATLGTALLGGAFVLMARAEAPTWAMLAWGVVALVAVAAFLARFRVERVQEALLLAGLVAVGQTFALHAVLVLLMSARMPAPAALVRHLVAFGVLDALTLVTATLAGHWFPQRPSSR
ncbi:MAG TPA: hypothetical protein VFI53_04195 [Myxococcaceae bacterium]|nr:hypothetical protein [Myxococcaceae bacterium]